MFFNLEYIDPLMFSQNEGVNVKFEFEIEAFTCFFIYRIVGESTYVYKKIDCPLTCSDCLNIGSPE